MRRHFTYLICFVSFAPLTGVSACTSADSTSPSSFDGGAAGEAGAVDRADHDLVGGAAAGTSGGQGGVAEGSGGDGGAGPAGASTAGAGGVVSDSGAGGEGSDSGASGAHDDGELADEPMCDPTAEDVPDDEFRDTNCDGIDGDESHSVFVAPTGGDDALGTRTSPFLTLSHALEVASLHQFAVLVCNGIYTENIVIKSGQRVYGGYACSHGWQRVKDRAIVQPARGLALLIDSVADPVVMDRFAFRAPNGTAAGESSQVGGIRLSSAVTLSHVEFAAGNGAAGLDGTVGADAPSEPESGADGDDTPADRCCASSLSSDCKAVARGGRATTVKCEYNGAAFETHGGDGGDGANFWRDTDTQSCLIGRSWGAAGARGRYRLSGSGWKTLSEGGPGGRGDDGASGDGAALGIGDLQGALYVAANTGSDGETGLPGWPGSGGDGGESQTTSGDVCQDCFWPGSGGGQGGPGGCGGAGGKAGGGGGASLGLVILKSKVELSWARFITGKGGTGGAGARGGHGQPGGLPGNSGAGAGFAGTAGEVGGDGGDGGAGGPGGGGPSIGILYYGTAPVLTDGTFEIGQPGAGGELVGGKAAAIGVTGEIYEFGK